MEDFHQCPTQITTHSKGLTVQTENLQPLVLVIFGASGDLETQIDSRDF
jgi:hypothetical protein